MDSAHLHIHIRTANTQDAQHIAEMTVALTREISAQLGVQHFDLNVEKTRTLCQTLLDEGRYVALLAQVDGEHVGFVGISEGRALYAEGALATMQEFFVTPAFRTHGVGAALIEAAMALAQQRGWQRMEVCTPPLPEFNRSLAFYEQNGFEITGGRKLKRIASMPPGR